MVSGILRGGTVIDGTGRGGFAADIAIESGRIRAIGDLRGMTARHIIDCTGAVVTPGFIDIHRHADGAAFRPGFGTLELYQGLTTIVNGNCGLSAAPMAPAHAAVIRDYLAPITGVLPAHLPTESMAAYLRALPALPLHVGMLVGGGTLRASAAGYALNSLEERHFRGIHREMERALAEGALGVSLGLGYAPECFYTTPALIRALAPLAHSDIPLTVHLRQEGGGVAESVQEMLTVAKALRCPLHISHLKAMGRENWGVKIPRVLRLLENARASGLDVTCDVYPYTAGSTQLLHILPPDFLSGGIDAAMRRLREPTARRELADRIETGEGFDNIAKLAGWDGIYLTSLHLPENRCYQGKSLTEIAAMRGTSPLDACCDLLAMEKGQITMIDFMAAEEDIARILRSGFANVISDATYPSAGQLHPRVYGTFPHLVEHFVQKRHILSLEQAVSCMTEKPAQCLRLAGKGRVAVGYDADLCVFAPEEIHARSTYAEPCQLAEGLRYVLVGGEIALQNGQMTAAQHGQVIRRPLCRGLF